jgi:hypothetical protein
MPLKKTARAAKVETPDMNRVVVNSKVGSDGVLHLALPVGVEEADKEVRITVEPIPPTARMTQEEWAAWVESMAGSISDPTFERPPQPGLEERDPFE